MPDQQQPLLPQATGPGARPAAAADTEALSLDDTVRIYGVSVSTLRRKLRAGEIAGAYKVPGPKGDEWRIPAGALEHLGYRPSNGHGPILDEPPSPAALAQSDEVAVALRAVADVVGQLAAAQRQLNAAEADRGQALREREDARVELATARAQLDAATERAERLEGELERARRRRWWQLR